MSPRVVDADRARTIIAALPQHVVKVGLFVNERPKEICRLYDDLKLDLIQLHGDEPPESLPALGGRPVMKAFGVEAADLNSIESYLTVSRHLGCLPRLVLVDAPRRHGFGGSGKLADWSLAKAYQSSQMLDDPPPLVLAGGLKPKNVAEAIRATGVCAVDTASGVESRPGIKEMATVARFVQQARSALTS